MRSSQPSAADTKAMSEINGDMAPLITLEPVEEELRTLLLAVAEHVKIEDGKDKASQLRLAGGWVRDKLLGVASHDVDVAIDDTTGEAFGQRMKAYLELPDKAEQHGLMLTSPDETAGGGSQVNKARTVRGLHKIKANPERSKQLETVTTKLLGLDVDLVNLRKEVYDDKTRTPRMEFADGPEEDAFRRDATVNALFYNLQTQQVEDFTGRGLEDMEEKILRTPLEPFQTFQDDPLRVLRLVRFASRLGYSIDDAAKQAMQDQAIKKALREKISRERVGVEVEKMLKGPDPLTSLSLIDEVGLYSDIFCIPPPQQNEKPTPGMTFAMHSDFSPDTSNFRPSLEAAQKLLSSESSIKSILVPDDENEFLAWVLSCFVPFADAPEPQKAAGTGKAPPPIAATVAREGIKAPNKVSDVVALALYNFADTLDVKDTFTQIQRRARSGNEGQEQVARDILGQAIRRWGATWQAQTVYAVVLDVLKAAPSGRDAWSEWADFLTHLESENLLDVYTMKPIIDGKTLAKGLDTKTGPWMKDALEVVMAWQLRNPDTATKEGAIQAVADWRSSTLNGDQKAGERPRDQTAGELTAALIHHFLLLTIRPLFSKTSANHSDSITALGRAKQPTTGITPRKQESFENQSVTRPWKADNESYSVDLLRWCIRRLRPDLTEREWPLIIPPLLTLLDDTETRYKALGADLLKDLLDATSPTLLTRTGLATVFEESLQPSMHFLPTLTPEDESKMIVAAAYPAYLTLLDLRSKPSFSASDLRADKSHREALARLLHRNLLPSFRHIEPFSNYPTLTSLLLVQTQKVITALGIDTVAQLIHIIPLLRQTLADDPFAVSSVDGLRCMTDATQTLGTVIRNAWVRMPEWRAEVLDILCRAWIRLGVEIEAEGSDTDLSEAAGRVQQELRGVLALLKEAVDAVEQTKGTTNEPALVQESSRSFEDEMKAIVDADDRLRRLCGPQE